MLGCYYSGVNDLFILRVDRADLTGIMPVTAAHEMLHAAYEQLSAPRKAEIDTMIAEFLATTPTPRIQETLAEYDADDPSVHESEAHSLVGTEVRVLPPELERYYSRYFDDRSAVVTMFEGYQQVFDNLEAEQDRLLAEIAALDGRLELVARAKRTPPAPRRIACSTRSTRCAAKDASTSRMRSSMRRTRP